jgi:tripartite-type tricarboxylate transporter receptor subunit TctC
MMPDMKWTILGSVALALGFVAGSADAQSWPDRPVHIVVPLTAGSATDVMARMVAKQLSQQLGQSFIVENKPGAGGTIGTAAVARARPDGYTLLVQSASYTVTPTTYPNTPYDTQRDLTGVTPLGLLPQALVVAPSRGIDSVRALIAAAKAKPGTLNYGSAGVGTANQLNAERFRIGAGIDAVHVPFKGTPEVLNDVLAGRVDYFFCPVNVCVPRSATSGCWRWAWAAAGAPPRCPICRRLSSSACPTRTIISGSGCSCRPARRARSSTGSTPRPRARSRARNCARAWRNSGRRRT